MRTKGRNLSVLIKLHYVVTMTASDFLFRPDKFYSWLKVACLTAISNQVQHLPSPIWRSLHHKMLLDNCQICEFQWNLGQWNKPLYFSFQITPILTLFSSFIITSLAAMERDSSLIRLLIQSILNIQLVLYLNHDFIQFKFWISKPYCTCTELVKVLVIIWVKHLAVLTAIWLQ